MTRDRQDTGPPDDADDLFALASRAPLAALDGTDLDVLVTCADTAVGHVVTDHHLHTRSRPHTYSYCNARPMQ